MEKNESSSPTNMDTTFKQQLKRARITAIVLALMSVTSILFFVYGQIKSIEANRNNELNIQLKEALRKQNEVLLEIKRESEERERAATKALEECQKR